MPTVVIVDGYSTGAELARGFASYGWQPVHVQSTETVPVVYLPSFRPGDYAVQLVHRGDVPATAAMLAPLAPHAVIAGAETGVLLADALNAALGLPGNDPPLSQARRNKFHMIERLRGRGLKVARQFKSGRRQDVVAWARQLGDWPVVVKPLDSAGTDGVSFCYDVGEVERAFDAIHGRANRMGSVNEEVLVQSFLRGVQYFVNAVSYGGRHVIGEVWREAKRQVADAAFVNDLEVLIDRNGPVQDTLVRYTVEVLDALGIAYGPSHTELMLTEDGPVLVETAARMMGSVDPRCIEEALGYSQVSLTVDAYVDPKRFLTRSDQVYEIRRGVYCVALISEQEGTIRDVSGVTLLEKLPSYYSRLRIPEVGDPLRRTVDLFSSPGIVYLSHADSAVLEADYRQIRAWERAGALFGV